MSSSPIHVAKAFLPAQEEYQKYLSELFKSGVLTNYGPLVTKLEFELQQYLRLPEAMFVANGTLALQLALRALDLKGEVITTPYSYVATTSSILWEGCQPVFVDIDPQTFCIDPKLIESKIGPSTSAILATHVYGVPCQVEQIQEIADRYDLKVIYDGAHVFGSKYKDRSLFAYGDISTASFHATKIFHTVEGGAIFVKDSALMKKLKLMRSFGHYGDEHFILGINAKNSELHAAMGLCNLPYMTQILKQRRQQWTHYHSLLLDSDIQLLKVPDHTEYNHSYFPIILKNESQLERVLKKLAEANVFPRRYFYPSLNELPYLNRSDSCPISERMARTVLCLPLFHELEVNQIELICSTINSSIRS